MNSWLSRFISLGSVSVGAASLGTVAMLAGCGTTPSRPAGAAAAQSVPPAPAAAAANAGAAPAPVAAADAPVPEPAAAQYAAALELIKSGKGTAAEPSLTQLARAYPQFAGPELNLGLIYLRDGRLPEAVAAFQAALERNPHSAVAGDELGIALRRSGKFAEAEAAYQAAIAADENYAPAHLNLGVLYDLYLAEPQKALDQFERYIAIAGENKQVAGWVVELRKRVAAPAAKKEPA